MDAVMIDTRLVSDPYKLGWLMGKNMAERIYTNPEGTETDCPFDENVLGCFHGIQCCRCEYSPASMRTDIKSIPEEIAQNDYCRGYETGFRVGQEMYKASYSKGHSVGLDYVEKCCNADKKCAEDKCYFEQSHTCLTAPEDRSKQCSDCEHCSLTGLYDKEYIEGFVSALDGMFLKGI